MRKKENDEEEWKEIKKWKERYGRGRRKYEEEEEEQPR